MKPQFICLTCKTVIGPIWDDYDNQCKCRDPYEFEVYRVMAVDLNNQIVTEPLDANKPCPNCNDRLHYKAGNKHCYCFTCDKLYLHR